MSLLKNRFLPSGLYSIPFQYIWRERTVCFGLQRQSISPSNPSRFSAALAGTATANLVPLTFHCDHSIVIHTNTGQPKAMSDQSRVIVDNLEMLTQKQQPPSGEQSQQEHQQQHKLVVGWDANKNSTLLLVATLITTLTYQIGCNPPGGFWQESGKDKNGKEHEAGAPIMRDLYPERYWLFMTAAWVGFGDSMLLTLWLLGNAPVSSRRVRWSFIVAYSSLQLTYISAMFGTSLIIDLATWAGVMIFLTFVVGLEKEGQNFMVHHSPCCGKLWH